MWQFACRESLVRNFLANKLLSQTQEGDRQNLNQVAEAGQLQQGWFPVSWRWCCCEDSLSQTQLAELCHGKPKATGALAQAEAHWDLNLLSPWLEGYSGDRGSCSFCSALGEIFFKNRNGLIFPSNYFSLFSPSPQIFLFRGKMTHFFSWTKLLQMSGFLAEWKSCVSTSSRQRHFKPRHLQCV